MLDLKAKLAAAGLVSAADVAAAERKSPRGPTGPKGQERRDSQRDQSDRPHDGRPQSDRQDNRPHDGRQDSRPQSGRQDSRSHDGRPQSGRQDDTRSHDGRPQRDRQADARSQGPRQHGDRRPGEQQQRPPAKPARPAGLDVVALKRGGKGEAYDAIRRAVERSRLDPVRAIPGEHASAFHFTTAGGLLSRLMLEPEAHAGLVDGGAGIIAFMSHHGLAHGVVPRPLAEAVFEVFPYWLRVLKDHPGAGQQEPPREPKRSDAAPATPEPGTAEAATTTPATAELDTAEAATTTPAAAADVPPTAESGTH